MKLCQHCRAELKEEDRFCHACGRAVGERPPDRPLGLQRRGLRSPLSGVRDELRDQLRRDLDAGAGQPADSLPPELAAPSVAPPAAAPAHDIHYRLDAALLPRVKRAALFIAVGEVDGQGAFSIQSSGSGFVIHPGGYVVTNRHVVQDASQVVAIFDCGTPHVTAVPAEVTLGELPVDLALLRVSLPAGIAVLPLGDSAALSETDPVWAIGYPLGINLEIILQQAGYQINQHGPEVSVRQGNITALRHDTDGRIKLLEHNCNIAPGNSGGPLADRTGAVVGVNTLGLGTVGPAEVTNYAIPSQVVIEFLRAVEGPDLA